MSSRRSAALALVGLLLPLLGLASMPAAQAAPAATQLDCDVKIVMRDGTRLSANVSRPVRAGHFPTLLTTTPYGKDAGNGGEGLGGRMPDPTSCGEPGSNDTIGLAKDGYVVVSVDWRGTGNSDAGDWYAPEWITDSMDILDWIQAQAWSNGRVGVTGCSNLGGSTIVVTSADQLRMRQGKPRAVYAAWADSYFPDVYRASVGTAGGSTSPASYAIVGLIGGSWAYGDPTQHVRADGGAPEPVRADQPVVRKTHEVNLGTSSYDAFWQAIDTTSMASQIDVPIGMSAAESDMWQLGLMSFQYSQLVKKSPHSSFFLSPGGHCTQGGWEKLSFAGKRPGTKPGLVKAWFDRWIKGAHNGVDALPNFNIYPVGGTGWTVGSATMPAKGTSLTTYYLDNAPRASVSTVGRLVTRRPSLPGQDRLSCTWCGLGPAAFPTDALSLRYAAAPVARDTTLAGNVAATVYANFDKPDAAIAVNLIDVAPDGSSAAVANGQIRARDRAIDPKRSIYAPDGRLLDAYHPLTAASQQAVDGVAAYNITLTPAAHVVPKGHHVELRVSFTDNKYQLPTPLLTSMAGANMDVIHGGKVYASEVTLPIITGPSLEKRSTFNRSLAPIDRVLAAEKAAAAPAGARPATVGAPSVAVHGTPAHAGAPHAREVAGLTPAAMERPWSRHLGLPLVALAACVAVLALPGLVRRRRRG
jgi:predicted acyl esterase